MKTIKVFITSLALITLTIFSCSKDQDNVKPIEPTVKVDPCLTTDCGTYGICNQGTCDCADPYEFDETGKCSRLAYLKFIGSYQVDESCTSSTASYTSEIRHNNFSNDSTVIIKNFWESFTVNAIIKGDSIFIRRQTPGNYYQVEGQGKYSDGTVTINTLFSYIYDPNNISTTNCTFIYNR